MNGPSSWMQGALVSLRAFHADVVFTGLARLMGEPIRMTSRSVMVIAPHQDDETFGCGGLIALKRQSGVDVQVVFLTDGGNSPLPAAGNIQRTDLGTTRIREARAALAALGVPDSAVHFLGFPDSGLSELPEARREEITELLHGLLVTHQPQKVLLPHRHDGHGDHEAAYRFVIEAVRRTGISVQLLQYAIWRPWLHPVYRTSCFRELSSAGWLSIAPVMEEKNAAIEAYTSQLATLPRGFISRFHRPCEVYFPVNEPFAMAWEKAVAVLAVLVCLLGWWAGDFGDVIAFREPS